MILPGIQTRVLIISDTHGYKPLAEDVPYDEYGISGVAYRDPLPAADVAIHCGDLTLHSTTQEYEKTFSMLRELSAPLKLVIPGNHDRVLDREFWQQHVNRKSKLHGMDNARAEAYRQRHDEARAIIADAAVDGVHLLDEGTHEFELANGALLRVYASPMTPEYGHWAFQYPDGTHEFDIPKNIDVAITHGPPKDVLDTTSMGERVGCPKLFDAIYKAKPKVHCFGHIHESWGAKLVTWKSNPERAGPYCAADVINLHESRWIEEADPHDTREERVARLQSMYRDKCRHVDLSPSDLREQTLFVNAAIMDVGYKLVQVPWLINMDLPRS